MSKKATITLPVSLTGLFDTESDQEDNAENGTKENGFQNEFEIVKIVLGGMNLAIRQMVWHQANANLIWPGTYNLVDHILSVKDSDSELLRYQTGKSLELGSATGALSIALTKIGNFDLITSDIDDEGIVEENIKWNFSNNGKLLFSGKFVVNCLLDSVAPLHIPHTWGTGWKKHGQFNFKFIIASDILLYVSVYPNLVQTLVELFDTEPNLIEFLMSWNRRIQESTQFFDLMKNQGFQMHSHGKGLYSFYRSDRMDDYLKQLPR